MDASQKFIDTITSKRKGVSGYPSYLEYNLKDGNLQIKLRGSGKSKFRGLDAWGLAVYSKAKEEGIETGTILFSIAKDVGIPTPDLEALKRRVSYLKFNNKNIDFKLIDEAKPEAERLYSEYELFNRPDEEVRPHIRRRGDRDKVGRLEKDFQTFLYGKGLDKLDEERTNERLAVLGEDFFKVKRGGFCQVREFPTGAFKGRISERNRILPTEYVDIVTFNKRKELSVIELKLDDSGLEVISQILDYALFFKCYVRKLKCGSLNKLYEESGLSNRTQGDEARIVCYVVSNHFHPRFDEVAKYYSTKSRRYGFIIKKVELGHAEELGQSEKS